MSSVRLTFGPAGLSSGAIGGELGADLVGFRGAEAGVKGEGFLPVAAGPGLRGMAGGEEDLAEAIEYLGFIVPAIL